MALKAGYVGVKRWIYEKLQASTTKNTQDIADIWTDNNITGVKNFLPNNASSGTNNGVTYTVADDGTVSTANTATGYVEIPLFSWTKHGLDNAVDYFLTGCPAGGSATKYRLLLQFSNSADGSSPTNYIDYGEGVKVDDVSKTYWRAMINISSGQSAADLVFKPMLKLFENPDSTYASFALTNQQLTARTAMKAEALTIASNENFELSGSVHSIRRFGNICDIYSQFKCLTSDAAWTTLANAPKPYKGETVIIDVYPNGGVDTPIGALVSGTNGEFRLSGGKANKYYNVHLMYICEDAAGISRGASDQRSLDADPAERSLEVEEPEVVKKSTKKTTKKEVE